MDTNFPVKESSTLFSPHLLAPDLNPGHARTKQNSFVSRGIVLDIEKSDMSPDDYLRSFPELEMVIFSSFSHTPAAPRYRICMPTTHYMPPYVNEAICHMIARNLSDRRHGVDSQTFDCASLFYLPSKPTIASSSTTTRDASRSTRSTGSSNARLRSGRRLTPSRKYAGDPIISRPSTHSASWRTWSNAGVRHRSVTGALNFGSSHKG
jgi:hypothetical protein